MKTLESILKTISVEPNRCRNCKVKEGEEHPIQGLTVTLKQLPNQPKDEKYCQICFIEKSRKTKNQKKNAMLQLVKKYSFCMFLLCFIIGLTAISVSAQPGLPGAPAQAPIDGGLSLLAAAGGLFAYKKLKSQRDK